MLKPNLCKCGCGGEIEIKPHHKYHGIPKYINGHYWQGKKRPEHSKIMKGRKNPSNTERLIRNNPMNNPESRQKIGDSNRGIKNGMYGKGYKQRGKNNPNWKGGKVPENAMIRGSKEYKEWRQEVYERDDYTCQICNARGVPLIAHHLFGFANFLALRFSIWNGITLCEKCHYWVHSNKNKDKLYIKELYAVKFGMRGRYSRRVC